jgi:predicted short-subunit dehydrogenase-like oxidoreductase (DUF2520 family)
MTPAEVALVGRGRVGRSLARALARLGVGVVTSPGASPEVAGAATVLVTVPDRAIGEVARHLASQHSFGRDVVVLHTSGLLTAGALEALRPSGAALGSLHPLMTFRDPAGDPALLVGAPAIVEGDAMAVARARELAARLGMTPVVEVAAAAKPRYHAAAVFASNYLVVLAGIAERLAGSAGVHPVEGLFEALMARTLDHLREGGPSEALTGPVARGDAATITAHLAVLDGEVGELYRRLGREALSLASLGADDAAAVREALNARR